MNSSADEFRQSIEASLPPLPDSLPPDYRQYSIQASAPGLYAAFGHWDRISAGSRQAEADSVRASADYGERSPSLRTSASLRSSFPPLQVSESQDIHAPDQPSVNLSYAAHYPGAGPEGAQPVPVERLAGMSPGSLTFQQQQASNAAHQVSMLSTAPAAPAQGYNADGSVIVQLTGPPGSGLYPPVPSQQAQIGEQVGGPFSSPIRARSPSGGPDNVDPGGAAGREQHLRQQSPNGRAARQQTHANLDGVVQGRVVHMRRTDAWTKYIAYEGCLQVCMAELDGDGRQNARYFATEAFSRLRRGLGIDGLLLSQTVAGPAAPGGVDRRTNDICWDDLEPPGRLLNTVAFTNAAPTCHMRVRCQQLRLPTATVLQRICCRTRTMLVLPSTAGVHVHLAASDGSYDTVAYSLDRHGGAVDQGQAMVLPMEDSQQGVQLAAQPPQRIDILVAGPRGPIATGNVPYRGLLRTALLQREPVDEVHAASMSAGTSIEVQVRGAGEYQGKVATVTLVVTRVRQDVARYELAGQRRTAPDSAGVETVNTHMLRINACLAYDATMAAALEANDCGRHKLVVDGPWAWMLENFAGYFSVRSFYCILAHLRWVLKPGVATISTMCLDVITVRLRPLLEQSALRGLTTHELTLLEDVKKAVEMLLEVAFENYYALGDDQPREGAAPAALMGQGTATGWRPSVLTASFRLFRVMKDVFLPTDQDWLNTRFRIAAKKRWHHLESRCGYDQIRGLPRVQPPHNTRSPGDAELGERMNTHDSFYRMAERMGMMIRNDLEFDMQLQNHQDLLPSALNLPRVTAEEYMANFVEILRNMLSRCPPCVPSGAAVDLLVATASLQRYLQLHNTQMYVSQQHPGHLDAMELWRPHVLTWINSSRNALCDYCGQQEAEARLTTARVDAAQMPEMIGSIEGVVAPLVCDMVNRMWGELMLYERIIKNWSWFGPDLEAALCDVLRTVQGSLKRMCAGASNAAMLQQQSSSPHMHGGHRRAPSGPHAGHQPSGTPMGPVHLRSGSGAAYGTGNPAVAGSPHHHRSPGAAMGPLHHHAAMAATVNTPAGRNGVLLKEAVLLNSLKVLMATVPAIEDTISKWCGGTSVAPPGPPQTDNPGAEYNDHSTPHIGAQLAQVVKELRTDYSDGVTMCADRMANHIRSMPDTNIRVALNQPRPPSDAHTGFQQVSTTTQQREFVEALMRPILASCEDALQALRGPLDSRVFIAMGRALWDCMAKDLYEFVHLLQEGNVPAAWRLRKHAELALPLLCEFFRGRLLAWMSGCIRDRDLEMPNHVDKAQKLLAQNNAMLNITLNPI